MPISVRLAVSALEFPECTGLLVFLFAYLMPDGVCLPALLALLRPLELTRRKTLPRASWARRVRREMLSVQSVPNRSRAFYSFLRAAASRRLARAGSALI